MKYHLVTLGCQMNKSDSERVRTVLEAMGYQWTDNEQEANLLGILACSVRQKSIDKVYSRIHKWNSWKNQRNLITFLSGCILPADRGKFLKQFDLIFEIAELPQFSEMLSQYGILTPLSYQTNGSPFDKIIEEQKEKADFKNIRFSIEETTNKDLKPLVYRPEERIRDFWQVKPTYHSSFEAFIPIQNGCDKFCTYCAVPYTRGREVSRPSGEIMDELKELVHHGYKSITLLGQNVNSYGLDKNEHEITFPALLRIIGEYGKTSGKDFWVYFTSPHPRDMTEEAIKIISQCDCLAKQIHLPLQSGDDKVLKKMNRKHSAEDYRRIIHSIRKLLPEATLFTDIIVGFTGETDEQFENTKRAMEEFRFNMAYIARYSPRPGAASSRWSDDVPGDVKNKRLQILTGELIKHTLEHNRGLTGKKLKVLVTGKNRKAGYLSALTEGRIVLRFKSDDESLIGRFAEVVIESATEFALEAKFVKEFIAEGV
ncbi:MAG TPA: MiaB/RimO family radical SAM methylthiotransferase [Bacteroidales bacterium]|nr:MiaB/RimO family radical SAM methylthiotransferase [Bacteroidales bacterium]